MIYLFRCGDCGFEHEYHASIKKGPPPPIACWKCETGTLARVWTPPNFICDTKADEVPFESRVTENTAFGDTTAQGERKEAAYQRNIEERRQVLRDHRNPKSNLRHTHSVPAELYHGKIKQTGDKDYWKDPKNLNKHRSCKVG